MDIAENIAAIRKRIAGACDRAGRDPDSVRLMGVSKAHPAKQVREAIDAGLKLLGENKVQEAKLKIPECPGGAKWHFIGHLQTNKVKDAVRFFDMLQCVDSLHLAEEINKRAEQAARTLPVLLEVNVAGEASKFGYQPDQMLQELEALNDLPRLEIHGLMAIPPYVSNPEAARPYFRRLAELKRRCEDSFGTPLPELSMGMSGDFELAIEEGSTLVRVGTTIFGPRTFKSAQSKQET